MVLNAAAVSCFGILQFVSGTHAIYWRQAMPLHIHFFAGFGYANHAGAFLTLTLCIGLTLALYYLGRRSGPDVPPVRRSGAMVYGCLCLALPVILVGLYLSLSRAAILLAMAALVVFAWALRSVALRTLTKIGRFHALISIAALAVLCGLAVHAYAGRQLRSEVTGTSPRNAYDQTVRGRLWQAKAAAEIFRDHPWFGVGGWGYRYYAGFYVDGDMLATSARQKIGAANVHNDPVQFLAEFGAVGFGLLAATVVLLAWPGFSGGAWRREMVFFPLLGAAMTLSHSLIDLPFRCPAVLSAWFVVLAAIGTYAASLPPRQSTDHAAGR
jgi:O-antigen ligase